MPQMITAKAPMWERCWRDELKEAITDPLQLARELALDTNVLAPGFAARRLFPLRVPRPFVALMEPGNSADPLLRQVLTSADEFTEATGFSTDPLDEQDAVVPGLLHKYQSRVLMILKGGCAVNCRYCFRRHFPYADNPGNKASWQQALDYIAARPQIEEVILSGGDPLMANDDELAWLLRHLNSIPHLKLLRIHSRLPVVIPSRVSQALLDTLAASQLPVTLVLHINHGNELSADLHAACQALRGNGVTLLNQSVLLKGINDDTETLSTLSHRLFAAGILPYYLHLLDKVAGAAHFWVSDQRARQLMRELNARLSGYLVPRLAREEAGKPGKTLVDLNL